MSYTGHRPRTVTEFTYSPSGGREFTLGFDPPVTMWRALRAAAELADRRPPPEITTMGELIRADARVRMDCAGCGHSGQLLRSDLQQVLRWDEPISVGRERLACPRCSAPAPRLTFILPYREPAL